MFAASSRTSRVMKIIFCNETGETQLFIVTRVATGSG
jgi:hypothetical protein